MRINTGHDDLHARRRWCHLRLLDARALVSLSLERRLPDRIATPELRRRVFDALADAPRNIVSLEGGCSRSICASRAARLRHPCAICAGPAALSSAIRKSSAAIPYSAARACRCM
jgi:hypothetical protein